MIGEKERFGALVRRERMAKDIGLREMAKRIHVSPTYLSKVERDEFPPPAEDKVRAIAEIIDYDVDDLLAFAGRVASALLSIIKHHPVELAALLRSTEGLTAAQIDELARSTKQFSNDPKKENITSENYRKNVSDDHRIIKQTPRRST
jgi:transcriptional regulator with XRE-family HTH domain